MEGKYNSSRSARVNLIRVSEVVAASMSKTGVLFRNLYVGEDGERGFLPPSGNGGLTCSLFVSFSARPRSQ